MPKKLSPATIITLLKKAKTAYQKAAPDPKDEGETRHRKINEDLKLLRRFAQAGDEDEHWRRTSEVRKSSASTSSAPFPETQTRQGQRRTRPNPNTCSR